MEYGSRLRFVLLTIGAILLLVLSAWGIASIARNLINGPDKKTSQTEKINLTDYTRPNTSVKITVEGPIVADENFESYEIEVGQNFRRITVYKGYGKTVVLQKSYDNNDVAFESFMKALAKAGFTNSNSSTATEDERGSCATGKRYVYELKDFDEQVSRLWNTTCSTKIGTLTGGGQAIRSLFKAQIPEYQEFAKKNTILN
jgi:hypothetical protein